MKAIGGYFGLELAATGAYHPDAFALNTARNAFEYILLARGYQRVFVPFFICEVLLEPLQKIGVNYEYYSIDEKLEPVFDFSQIGERDAFLYTNYFGLKDEQVNYLATHCKNLIVDNAQSFFSERPAHTDCFYSPRKFFGVSDGAYLYTDMPLDKHWPQDYSASRVNHLVERWDSSAEQGYPFFQDNEASLCNQPIKRMSGLTKSILSSISYDDVLKKRKQNFDYLHLHLGGINEFQLNKYIYAPMTYPFLGFDKELRKKLIEHKIYTAQYWPSVLDHCRADSVEYRMAAELVHFPIDQRIDKDDLDRIINLIK